MSDPELTQLFLDLRALDRFHRRANLELFRRLVALRTPASSCHTWSGLARERKSRHRRRSGWIHVRQFFQIRRLTHTINFDSICSLHDRSARLHPCRWVVTKQRQCIYRQLEKAIPQARSGRTGSSRQSAHQGRAHAACACSNSHGQS